MGRHPATEPSKDNRRIFAAVERVWRKKKRAPSVQEVAVEAKCPLSTAQYHVNKLCDLGYLEKEPHQARTLRILHGLDGGGQL